MSSQPLPPKYLIDLLAEIERLPTDDRLCLVERIWDSIAAEQQPFFLSEAHKTELAGRIADYKANPDDCLTWEEVKAELTRAAETPDADRSSGAADPT